MPSEVPQLQLVAIWRQTGALLETARQVWSAPCTSTGVHARVPPPTAPAPRSRTNDVDASICPGRIRRDAADGDNAAVAVAAIQPAQGRVVVPRSRWFVDVVTSLYLWPRFGQGECATACC